MEYREYRDIPDTEKTSMGGAYIKHVARRDGAEVLLINGGRLEKQLYSPWSELDDKRSYNVYEAQRASGAGICYEYLYVFV